MENKTTLTAKKFNILEKIEKLEKELLSVPNAVKIEFDLDGFYDDIRQVIFVVKYNIPVSMADYFAQKASFRNAIKEVAYANGLLPSGDKIEDYGTSYYFVFDCDTTWRPVKSLLLRKEMFDKLLSGEKSSTSRFGERKFSEGETIVFKMTKNEEIICEATITKVTVCSFEDLTEEEAKKEGYSSLEDLKKALIDLYNPAPDDIFTLIHFVKG